MSPDQPSPEEKKTNPILDELDKKAAGTPAAEPALQPIADPVLQDVETPATQSAEAITTNDSPQEMVTDAMRRLDSILKKIKEKQANPEP